MSCQGHFFAKWDIFYRKGQETKVLNSHHIKTETKREGFQKAGGLDTFSVSNRGFQRH